MFCKGSDHIIDNQAIIGGEAPPLARWLIRINSRGMLRKIKRRAGAPDPENGQHVHGAAF
jgi:hypothetical protein